MAELTKITKTRNFAPNIMAVVNFPENIIPARGYIISKEPGDIDLIYGSLEKAADYFIWRIKKIPKNREIYIITFISGKTKKEGGEKMKVPDKDLFVYPYVYSNSGKERTKAEQPHIIKNGVRQPWEMNEGDDHHIILGNEAIHRRMILSEAGIEKADEALIKYTKELPQLISLEYISILLP